MKIKNGSAEWNMFNDFWKLRQVYHDSDGTDKFWDDAIKDVSAFISKYENESFGGFASDIGNAILEDAERTQKGVD